MIIPRYYQNDFARAVLTSWGDIPGSDETYRKVLATLPTGLGKTICAAMLFQEIVNSGGRPCFAGDTDELVLQPLEKIYRATGISCGLEKASDRASLRANAVVASLQTIMRPNRLARFPRDHFTHIIFDESHRNPEAHQKVMEHFDQAKILGLTATAFRSNMKDLSAYYETVAYKMELFDAVDAGFVPPIKVCTVPLKIDLSEVKQSSSFGERDYNAEGVGTAITPFFEQIAGLIIEQFSDKQIVIFNPLIQTSKDLVSVFKQRGIRCEHIDGTSEDRNQILKRFERKEFQAISCSSLLSTGWDCPTADALLNLRPTRSVGLFRQEVGRIARVLPGVIDHLPEKHQAAERRAAIAASAKPHCTVIDLLWQTKKFGLCGPSSLIADNEEEAEELNKRIRKKRNPEDLQEMRKALQEEREKKLLAQLAAANQRKSMFIDAQELGALISEPELGDYEPVFAWESKPMSEKQEQILSRNGINIESVKGRGHASKLLDAIFGRSASGAASIPTVRALMSKGVTNPARMTEAAAAVLLGDDVLFPFGKHQGKPLRAIPDGYWSWLESADWFTALRYPVPHAYMMRKKPLANPGR